MSLLLIALNIFYAFSYCLYVDFEQVLVKFKAGVF